MINILKRLFYGEKVPHTDFQKQIYNDYRYLIEKEYVNIFT